MSEGLSALGFLLSAALMTWGNRRLWLPPAPPKRRVKEWHAGVALMLGTLGMIASSFCLFLSAIAMGPAP